MATEEPENLTTQAQFENDAMQDDHPYIAPIFRQTPWVNSLLSDPSLTIHARKGRGLIPTGTNYDAFMKHTLATPGTIAADLRIRPIALQPTFPRATETMVLYALGPMLSGHDNIAHGGLIATLLDEFMGILLVINQELEADADPEYMKRPLMTVKLDIGFRNPVPVPGVVLGRARISKIDGRKVWMIGTIEDGMGNILTEAEGLFVEIRRGPRETKQREGTKI